MPRRWPAAVLAAVAAAVLLFCGQPAQAHPLGSGIINRYARLDSYSDTVRLTYVLDYGWSATGAYLPFADTNHDGKYSDDELDAFARSIQTTYGVALRASVRTDPLPLDAKTAGIVIRPDVNGFPSIKLTLVYDAVLPQGLSGDVILGFEISTSETTACGRRSWSTAHQGP